MNRSADHLVPLPGETISPWALWRTFAVRGAGFPAADVLPMADAVCAAAADRLGAVEEEAESLRQAALEALRGELASADKSRLDPLVKAIQRLKRRQLASTAGLAGLAQPTGGGARFLGGGGPARRRRKGRL